MEKQFKYILLLDYYGKLLTDKQHEVMERHYEMDCSLSEIAEQLHVSRQSIMGTILKAQKTLDEAEEKLGFVEKIAKAVKKLKEQKHDGAEEVIRILEE